MRTTNDLGMIAILDGKMSRRYGEVIEEMCDAASNVVRDKASLRKWWRAIEAGLKKSRAKGLYDKV